MQKFVFDVKLSNPKNKTVHFNNLIFQILRFRSKSFFIFRLHCASSQCCCYFFICSFIHKYSVMTCICFHSQISFQHCANIMICLEEKTPFFIVKNFYMANCLCAIFLQIWFQLFGMPTHFSHSVNTLRT